MSAMRKWVALGQRRGKARMLYTSRTNEFVLYNGGPWYLYIHRPVKGWHGIGIHEMTYGVTVSLGWFDLELCKFDY